MKRKTTIVCIFLVLILSMFVTCSFVACDKEDDNRIALTVDNVQQYVTLSCKGYGDPSSYKNGYYSRLFASASTEGIAGYEYENVFITVNTGTESAPNFEWITINKNDSLSAEDTEDATTYDDVF